MPGQAILDLPVINFEIWLEDPQRLHALCVESYGLAGYTPHPDAVFHLAASLWRYRTDQTLAQITGLATFFLKALSEVVACRRRAAAAKAAGAKGMQLREINEELEFANRDLDDLTRLCNSMVSELLDRTRKARTHALRVVEDNLQQMGNTDWAGELDRLARGLLVLDATRIDWSGPLDEVLEALEDLAAGLPVEGNGSGRKAAASTIDNKLIDRMQSELREYQAIANHASVRLRQIDRERRDLEAMLAESEQDRASRTTHLEEERQNLELTVSEARQRLESIEHKQGTELNRLRQENRNLRAENERLSAELLHAVSQSTEGEDESEGLLETIEQMDSQRLEAAAAIEQLSARLGAVQQESVATAQEALKARAQASGLQKQVEELRLEVVAAQDKLTQAHATIRALETHSGRSAEVEQVLTESEGRLAETEEKLIEAESRLEQLTHQLEDRDYRIGQLEQRATVQKRTVDTLSGQLAESETLSEEHAARIRELERENERLRRDLSDAQTRMLDSRGDIDEAREAERAAKAELDRVKEDLRVERSRVDKTRVETGRVRDELTAAHKRADSAEAELKAVTLQLEESRKLADKRRLEAEQTLAAARAAERRAKDAEEKLARATKDLADAESKQSTGLAAAQQAAQQAAMDLATARDEAQRARAELDGVRRSEGSTSDAAMRLRAELAQVRTELAASREEAAAARDLLNDKLQRAEEKLALGAERARNGEAERKALAEALGSAEQRLQEQAAQDNAVLARARAEAAEQAKLAAQARGELDGLKGKLNESDAYVITRERELEKHANRVKYLLSEIGAIADLRARFEAESDSARRDEVASLLARKLDTLFVEAGKRVTADRRTEKIVILHVKKDAQQIEQEAEKPFVATKEKEISKAAKPSPRKKRDAQS